MTAASGHEAWADSTAAYLLGALPDGERAGFEAHLAACGACREEVDRLKVAADALPASPPQLEPPAELKDRIMAVVNSEAELLRAAGSGADAPARATRARRRLAWWPPRPAPALAGAAAVLALGVAAGLVGGSALRGDEVRTVVAEVQPTGAQARLLVRDEGHSTLVTRGLPRPESGRVYQVWLKRPGRDPEPTDALFRPRGDGSASVDVPGRLKGVEKVMVTSEPDGGSRTPTPPVVVEATLT